MNNPFQQVLNGHHLTESEAHRLITTLAQGEVEPALAGAVLATMRHRGESAAEICGAAEAMLDLAHPVTLTHSAGLLDTCGTGGDGSNSLNLSTAVSLLAAACGQPVVKHGNRSISSQSGSADMLAALPIHPEQRPEDQFYRTGFAFLFAPNYHPAMAHIMPVRRALGVRTLFNILGPLCNPARPAYQVIGTYDRTVAQKMAHALRGLRHNQRAFVIHGHNGWDEATPICPFTVFEVVGGDVHSQVIHPNTLGLPKCEAEDLRGGDARYNAMRLRRVLTGREYGAHRNAVLLGTSLALHVCGAVSNLSEGLQRAAAAIDEGDAEQLLTALAESPRKDVVNG